MNVYARVLPILVVCLAPAGGCVVLEPNDGMVLQPEAAVLFRGFASLPEQQISLQARDAGGRFETFAVTRAERAPEVLRDGSRIYAWQVNAVVPHWHGSGCERRAELRALGKVIGRSVPLFAYGAEAGECLQDALDRGTPVVRAMRECAAVSGGTFELFSGSTKLGDVTVTTQAEADALACVKRIEGSLTVQPVEPLVQLPVLAEVTGDVLIEVEDTTSEMFSPAEVVELSMLSSIGGTLRFHHLNGMYGSDVRIGLPALTTLPGDLELALSSFNGYNKGLDALAAVGGDVHILGRGDYYPLELLQNLRRIAGSLTVETSGAGSSGGILPRVLEVGGDVELLSLRHVASGNSFVELQTVGGGLRLRNTYVSDSTFPQLTRVASRFVLENDGASALPESVVFGSASGISLGALTITNTGLSVMPFSTTARVDRAGAIRVQNNADLCQASVDTFVATQQLAGWSGPLTVAGNTGACVP